MVSGRERKSTSACASPLTTHHSPNMTDKEIIALVESKLPQELSLEEIELIRQRIQASPSVRRALAAQLEMNQYLAGLFGKVEFSAESIVAKAGRASRFRRSSIITWLGLSACLLLIGGAAAWAVWSFVIRPRDNDAKLAQADGNANVTVVKKPEIPAPATRTRPRQRSMMRRRL